MKIQEIASLISANIANQGNQIRASALVEILTKILSAIWTGNTMALQVGPGEIQDDMVIYPILNAQAEIDEFIKEANERPSGIQMAVQLENSIIIVGGIKIEEKRLTGKIQLDGEHTINLIASGEGGGSNYTFR